MEIEYFIPPDEDVWRTFHEQWLTDSYNFLLSIGLRPELISRDVHPDHKLAHYARACTDLMFKFPFGTQELTLTLTLILTPTLTLTLALALTQP